MDKTLSKDELEAHLSASDRRKVFEALGFRFNGHQPSTEGYVTGVLGPPQLGEGEGGNFSVNVLTGAVKDFGSSGYTGDLYSAVMETCGLSFPEALNWVAQQVGYTSTGTASEAKEKQSWNPFRAGRHVATYHYTDENGSLLYEVRRYEVVEGHPAYPDKTFRPFRYAPEDPESDQRGFVLGCPKHLRTLYRLSEVRAAAEARQVIFVTEGEKDANTVSSLGLNATTSGSSNSWQGRFAELIVGAHLVILPDNDKKGREYAKAVAKSCHGSAKSVRILALPGLPPKGDVTDWIEAGGTEKELRALAEKTRPFRPAAQPSATSTDHAKAAGSDESEYIARDGQILYCGTSAAKVVADFEAQITTEITSEEGSREYHICGKTRQGRSFEVDINAAEFEQERTLKSAIGAAAGAQAPVRAGMTRHLSAAIKALSTNVNSQRRYTRTGWSPDGFLIPGREIEGVQIALNSDLSYRLSPSAQLKHAREALEALILSLNPKYTLPVIVYALTGPLAYHIKLMKRYGFFIRGRTGSLKTSFMQVLMCIWGAGFLEDRHLLKMGEGMTRNARMAYAKFAHDLPIPFDNYKPSTGSGDRDFINLIHTIVEGGEKARLNRNAELRKRSEIRCWPIFTGEDLPSTDPASLARLLTVESNGTKTRLTPS